MTTMTGGEATVQTLLAHDIDIVFGLPGIQNDWLYNALYDARDQIRVIHPRHEQGAGFMALGYAMATGKPSVFNVVPGPGLLNASAALATAYGVNAPVFCITGQIPSYKIGKNTGFLHEIPHQLEVMQGLTKYAGRAMTPEAIPAMMAEAFQAMQTNRPQPVGIEIPMDTLRIESDVDPETGLPLSIHHHEIDLDQIENAAKALGNAKQPMIFVGSGAQNVSSEVTALAEMLQAPVIGYRTGQGIVDARHYLSQSLYAVYDLWKKADVVLAIGSNMRTALEKWGFDDEMTIIRIDADADMMANIMQPDVPILARAEDALPILLERVTGHNRKRDSREEEMLGIKASWRKQTAYLEPQLSYLQVIREELGEDGIFVEELTQMGYTARITYPVYHPRTYISTGYQGTLGYGFPTALGVKIAKPDVPVISVTGDGGFMFTMQELSTAMHHKIPLVTLVFNNNQYGNVQMMQKTLYDERVIATDLHNPDFVQLAHAFGANGFRVNSPEGLREMIRKGFASDLPTIIEVPVGDVPSTDHFRALPQVRGI